MSDKTQESRSQTVSVILRRELEDLREAVPLAPFCAYGVGGPAEFLVEARSTAGLRRAVLLGRELGLPVTVLGLATNIVVSDRGVRGLVVLARNHETRLDDLTFSCGAGAVLSDIIADLARRGLAGLEFAGNIPGSVGGAVVGNAGAYGRSMADSLVSVTLCSGEAEVVAHPRELSLGYRTSVLKRSGGKDTTSPLAEAVVLSATFQLHPGSRGRLLDEIDHDARLRRSKHPLECASCGSFFKNPSPQRPAARLIEEAGLKGLQLGRAAVSSKHANFLVALEGATAADVISLAAEVKRRVHEHCGVKLEEEVVRLGFD